MEANPGATVDLTIDGRNVIAKAGATILDAAREAGIFIPTLCHHESLSPYGACRFCTVEVESRGRTRLAASCTLPAANGMKVSTTSERVLRLRRILAELMLARCPTSTVVRRLASEIGVEKTRFRRPPGESATIVHEEGCILCGMCVRLCDDVLQVGALGFEGRGARRKVTTPFGKPAEACLACGGCSSICPTQAIEHVRIRPHPPQAIPFEFEEGRAARKPIFLEFPQAVPRVPVIDEGTCMHFRTGGCKVCEDNCAAKAIDHEMVEKELEVEVGTIVVATGFEPYDPRKLSRYGYGRLPDVLAALEFERMCHASGPTGGKIQTADGRTPEAVAVLHCIGSRDENHLEHCSRVCCMYSLKFAHLVREKTGADVYNFYIDIRTPGKGYEEFYKRLMREGVHFIRGKGTEVARSAGMNGAPGKLVVVCEDTLLGQTRRIPVDMVILSTGLQPRSDSGAVARTFGIGCAHGGFFLEKHPKLAPVETPSEGIFIAGTCQGPKDIPDSVAQGAAAAAAALSLMDRGKVVLEPIRACIDEERCSGCRLCIANCPYAAIEFDEEKRVSVVTRELCQGCGTCVAGCPSSAARQEGFEDAQILAEIEGALLQP